MADIVQVAVEVTPSDSSWQTASELIEQIKKKCPNGYNLSFIVKECFRVEKGSQTAEAVYQINNHNAVVGKNVYMN